MPRWETALLPWDLLCSPGRIAWGGDNKQWMDIATTRPNLDGINEFGFLQKIMKYDKSSVLCEACSASKILISVTYMGSNLQALIR